MNKTLEGLLKTFKRQVLWNSHEITKDNNLWLHLLSTAYKGWYSNTDHEIPLYYHLRIKEEILNIEVAVRLEDFDMKQAEEMAFSYGIKKSRELTHD